MADNKRIDILLEHLASHPESHNQELWYYPAHITFQDFLPALQDSCGATACIGGWTDALFRTYENCHLPTSELLGLSRQQENFVFYATIKFDDPEGAAIRALKYLKDNPDATHAELRQHENSGR